MKADLRIALIVVIVVFLLLARRESMIAFFTTWGLINFTVYVFLSVGDFFNE